jgi:hypothetical protein
MPQVYDPHAIGLAAGRLGSGARRTGKIALAVLGAALGEGDAVEILAQGRFRHAAGVVALVGGKVVLVNDRQWKPDVVVLPVGAELQVHGWQDDRSASLTFVFPEGQEVVDTIFDRPLAIELAQRIRDRAAAIAPPPNGPNGPNGT